MPKSIVIVDAEPQVRSSVRPVLQNLGYAVLEATTGLEALMVCAAHNGPVDLLLADLEMPGVGGLKFLEKFADRFPGVPVICMAAHSALESVPQKGSSVIRKPIQPDLLIEKVQELLGTPRKSPSFAATVSVGQKSA